MSPRPFPLPWILLIALVACCALAAPAEARDGPRRDGKHKSYVKQLEAQELEALRSKIPNWDQLDRGKQERIARGVVKLRTLSAEERAKLEQRVRELKERGKRDRPFRAEWMRYAQGVGDSIWQELPEAFRDEIERRRIRPAMAKMVLFHKVKSHVAVAEGQQFQPADLQAFPEPLRKKGQRYAAILADAGRSEKEQKNARIRLGDLRAHVRIEALRQRLSSEADGSPVPPEQFAAALRKTWPAAFATVVRDVGKHPERFAEMIERRSRHGGSGLPGVRDAERAGKPLARRELVGMVMQLERAARHNWKQRPDLQQAADRLIRQILVQDLNVDEAVVRKLPAFDQPQQRSQALGRLVGRLVKRGDGVRPGARGPRDGRRQR